MNTEEQNLYLMSEFLSDIELYYSTSINVDENTIILSEEEFHHAVKVMRNAPGDNIHITDGKGSFYYCVISKLLSDSLIAEIETTKKFKDKYDNLIFCITPLKNPDRIKFMLEKCVELGIKHFIFFNSQHSIGRIKNIERLQKILLAAMKQSLHTFLPDIKIVNSFEDLAEVDGEKIMFHQKGNKWFDASLLRKELKYYFIFGPEGGFSQAEISAFGESYILSENRLRSETAVIKCASLLS